MGKGSTRRPAAIPVADVEQNWDVAFAPIQVPPALADWAFEYKLGYQNGISDKPRHKNSGGGVKGEACPIKPWHSYAQARIGAWKAGQRAGRKARQK